MMKLLVVAGLIFGIFYFFYHRIKIFLRDLLMPPGSSEAGGGTAKNRSRPAGRIDKGAMVKCPVCGVYFPESTGVKGHLGRCCSTQCASKRQAKDRTEA